MTGRLGAVRRLVAVVVATALLLGAAGAVAVWGAARWAAQPLGGDDPYVLLVLGSDAGPPRAGSALSGRADAFQLLVVSPDRQHVSIVAVPRDSWVDVPGLGRSKINASLTRGPETAVATAEALSGLEVDDWIVTNFDGMIGAVEGFGRLRIEVKHHLRRGGVNLDPGVQKLTGAGALSFSRDRKSRPGGDLARAEAQARVLAAAHENLVRRDPPMSRIVEMLAVLQRTTASSLSFNRLVRLATLATTIAPENVAIERLDARVGSVGRASVVFLTDAAFATLADVREDGRLGSATP